MPGPGECPAGKAPGPSMGETRRQPPPPLPAAWPDHDVPGLAPGKKSDGAQRPEGGPVGGRLVSTARQVLWRKRQDGGCTSSLPTPSGLPVTRQAPGGDKQPSTWDQVPTGGGGAAKGPNRGTSSCPPVTRLPRHQAGRRLAHAGSVRAVHTRSEVWTDRLRAQ